MVGGSSPLARGLRQACSQAGRVTRIIPARAGFTLTPTEREVNNPDHPRSRGVYNDPITVGIAQWGSSPLARGLLSHHCVPLTALRIIPARAGFTSGQDD